MLRKLHVNLVQDFVECICRFLNCQFRRGIIHLLENEGIQLRRNEKRILNDINTDKDARLRFHVLTDNGKRKKRLQTREEKIYILINDCLTGDPSVHDLSLTQVSFVQ